MAKKNTHGGKRKNAGAKKKPYLEKLQGISLTVKANGAKVEKFGKEYLKAIARVAGQEVIDNLK